MLHVEEAEFNQVLIISFHVFLVRGEKDDEVRVTHVVGLEAGNFFLQRQEKKK